MKRSQFLMLFLSGILAMLGRRPRASGLTSSRGAPVIGAIRWDAWYDPAGGPVAAAVAKALAPEPYHFRLPFFAKIIDQNTVSINGDSQGVVDKEIEYASAARLSYWAFGAYPKSSVMMNCFHLYLMSTKKRLINFCLLSAEIGDMASDATLDWHVSLISDPSYQRVLAGRPLYFVGILSDVRIREIGVSSMAGVIRKFRAAVVGSGQRNPYIVVLAWTPVEAAAYCQQLGCDAIGAYSVNGKDRAAPFSTLARETERFWTDALATRLPVVPPIMTGLDRRPRVEHPMPWESHDPDADRMDRYYETATSKEIAAHIADCIGWMQSHQEAAEANAALIYAWNENDEGGWLIPTYPQDTSRLDAVQKALRALAPP